MSLRFISIGCVRRCATAGAGFNVPPVGAEPIASTSILEYGYLGNGCRVREADEPTGYRLTIWHVPGYPSPLSPDRRKNFDRSPGYRAPILLLQRGYPFSLPQEFSIASILNETFVSIILGCRFRRADRSGSARTTTVPGPMFQPRIPLFPLAFKNLPIGIVSSPDFAVNQNQGCRVGLRCLSYLLFQCLLQ